MQVFFGLTLFVSATLLFLVQPMFAKMVLPRLGGTPAVWNTCMVFYQAALLAGYLYAHFSTRILGTRRQAVLHLAVLALPLLVLPIALAKSQVPPSEANPIPWLLAVMTLSVGLPFFAVSASAPMLQAWFADTGHPAGKDPYFLYAASNLGSMLALLGYPLLVEPNLAVAMQSRVWQVGYCVLVALTVGCAALLWRARRLPTASAYDAASCACGTPIAERSLPPAVAERSAPPADEPAVAPAAPTVLQRLRWLGLSLAPSSLMLGVTTFISTDLASVPLLWVMPLTLYLLSFVLVFSPRLRFLHWPMVLLQPFLVAALAVFFYSADYDRMWLILLLHLAVFFVTAMVCHGELARSRPAAAHLTEFYIWMSVGGVLGGLLNALIAPQLFSWVAEYPLMIAAACMLRPRWGRLVGGETEKGLSLGLADPRGASLPVDPGCPGLHVRSAEGWLRRHLFDLLYPMWLLCFLMAICEVEMPTAWTFTAAVLVLASTLLVPLMFRYRMVQVLAVCGIVLLAALLGLKSGSHEQIALRYVWHGIAWAEGALGALGLGALLALGALGRPLRFGLSIAVVLLAGHVWFAADPGVLHQERSFFGVLRVRDDVAHQAHILTHGSTTHGMQSLEADRCFEPSTYFHHDGPLGRVFDNLIDPQKHRQIAVVGLGTGTIAAYAHGGQQFTYFEIDPSVVRISDQKIPGSEDQYYFTYTRDARSRAKAEVKIVLGDARLRLADQPDGRFDLLVIDAFSSDAIPMHLLTKEALGLYFAKLAPDGILMVHISNRYLKLAPVVGNLARDAGLTARWCVDEPEDDFERYGSEWVAVVRKPERLGPLLHWYDWEEIKPDDTVGVWTDDFSNILTVLTWWRESWLGKRLGFGIEATGE